MGKKKKRKKRYLGIIGMKEKTNGSLENACFLRHKTKLQSVTEIIYQV